MRRMLYATVVAALAAFADAQVVGWRGDGTGCFPKAEAPTQWGKVSTVLAGLRSSAEKPKGNAPSGTPATSGAVTEWQVLGPIPVEGAGKGIDETFVADEASCEPDAKTRVKGASWRKVTVPGTTLDFSPIFEKDTPAVEYVPYHELNIYKAPFAAYAHSYVYSASEGAVVVRVRAEKTAKVWLNGEIVYPSKSGGTARLKKGWNRLLVKAVNAVIDKKPGAWSEVDYPSWWFVDLSLTASAPFKTETKNIRWATELPSFAVASPLIVGDRVFVMAEPGRLICVNKADGRILWDRQPSFWDTLSADEVRNDAFRDLAAEGLPARLAEIRALESKPGGLTDALAKEREGVVAKIASSLEKADAKRFTIKPSGHGNCLPTPVCDGKFVYVVLGNGLVACYDLDGKLKWASLVSPGRNQEHGITSSAALAGGKLIVFHVDLAGIDLKTGRVDWKTDIWRKDPNYGDTTHQTPVTFRVATQDYVYIYGYIVRVSDGQLVWDGPEWRERQTIPTPIIVGGTLCDLSSSGCLRMAPLPTSTDRIALARPAAIRTFERVMGSGTRGYALASPLYHDGLVYVVDCMGSLFVLDIKAQKLVYRRNLGTGLELRSVVHPQGTAYASPVLAGKYLYLFGMDGTTIVLKPGRTYEEVARNKIEDVVARNYGVWPEGFASTPVADGKCLYIRGDKYLYCIGEEKP